MTNNSHLNPQRHVNTAVIRVLKQPSTTGLVVSNVAHSVFVPKKEKKNAPYQSYTLTDVSEFFQYTAVTEEYSTKTKIRKVFNV